MSVTNAYKVARSVTEFLGTCALVAGLMMIGPILQACGVIGG